MSKVVLIHFKCEQRPYSLLFKTSIEEINMSTLQARICKKVGLDEDKVKLKLHYSPLLVEKGEPWIISDDEDLSVYLNSIDNENRRCLLIVEITNKPQSSFGLNYEEFNPELDGVGGNAVTLYIGNQQAEPEREAVDEDDDDTRSGEEEHVQRDEPVDEGMDRSSYMRDEFVQMPPVVEATQFREAWEDGLGVTVLQEFPNKKAVQDAVDRAAFDKCFGFKIKKSDKVRYVVKCREESCKWLLRAAKITGSSRFSIRTYNKMHTCSRASQSTSNQSRKGTPRLVAGILHEDYPGLMETPTPKSIIGIVQNKLGLRISYSTALRGKNHHVNNLRGSAEDSYKKLYCYMHMLEKVNSGTVTSVKLDDEGKFHYLFVALGACIEGFKCMRKVITVDATHLKNGYGGVLVFASAQDPNRHHYPLAIAVLDGEKNDSWMWFFEKLKTVIPDSSELVFMSDRNSSLLTAVATVYPVAHHGYCIWHLSQNVKDRAYNVNKDVVAWRFIECSRHYTIDDHEKAYSDFVSRYPSAAKYLVETTENKKHTWARCYFPGERYNIDTSNCVESLNSIFKSARQYYLIPMLDAIIAKISEWFNDHRKEAASVPVEHKLVPFVENFLHDTWPDAKKLKVTELNWFERVYDVIAKTDDGEARHYTVNLLSKSCSCRFFDIQKYPCVHALAALIEFNTNNEDIDRHIHLHELCSRYYWVETWQLAYYRTVYLVPDECQWDVPEYVKQLEIKPKKKPPKKGRKKVLRFPGAGERRRPRTKNKRRPRQGLMWLVTGRNG